MRKLGIDYGDARVGIAITDGLNITVQGLETIQRNNSDKVVLKRIDELLEFYDIDTIVVGLPITLKGTKSIRTEETEKFIHKLKCKYNKLKIETMDERLTTVEPVIQQVKKIDDKIKVIRDFHKVESYSDLLAESIRKVASK